MTHATTPRAHAALFGVLGTLASAAAPAAVIQVERVRAGAVDAGGLRLESTAATPERGAALTLTIERLGLAAAGAWRDLHYACTLEVAADDHWQCEGPLRARSSAGLARGKLRVGHDGARPYARFASGPTRVTAGADGAQARVEWRKLPLEWLGAMIGELMPSLRSPAGASDGTATIVATPRGWAADGTIAASAAGFDSSDGLVAASGLGIEATWRVVSAGTRLEIGVAAEARAGEALYSPVYVRIPSEGVRVALELARSGSAPWQVDAWSIEDPGVLSAAGRAALNADGGIAMLEATRLSAALATALPRYAAGPLAQRGLDGLQARGTLEAALRWPGHGPPHGRFELRLESLVDGAHRFGFDGLEASLRIAEPDDPASSVRWRGAQLHRVPIGAASARFSHDGARIALLEPLTLPVAEGEVVLEQAERTDRGEGASWSGALRVEAVALGPLTEAFGWPRFAGTLSGRVPSLRGSGGRVVLDGELQAQAFDGRIRVAQLAIERLFGVAPSLAADISFDDLDLGMLTGAFDFGTIEGRLDGRIAGLRLVDWGPVAFDAVLKTDREHSGKRRISQRAVNNLSAVGGGAAGIQQGVLRFFDTFGYAEIGLSCRLADNVCTMGGLDSANGGYTIVRGSGLPHLTVVGHQRRVDWPVLVARLKAAIGGTAPVVR
jgi:hypothetical protein